MDPRAEVPGFNPAFRVLETAVPGALYVPDMQTPYSVEEMQKEKEFGKVRSDQADRYAMVQGSIYYKVAAGDRRWSMHGTIARDLQNP